MSSDERCPFNVQGLCFEMVSHGFSEAQLREQKRMRICNMGEFNGFEIRDYSSCRAYQSFEHCCSVPGTISQECYDAIRNAKRGNIDGKIVDLKTINQQL